MTCRHLQQPSPLGHPPLLTSPPLFPSSPSSGSSLDDRVLQSSVLHPLLSLSFLPGSCHPLKAFATTDILVSPKLTSSILASLSLRIHACPLHMYSQFHGKPRGWDGPSEEFQFGDSVGMAHLCSMWHCVGWLQGQVEPGTTRRLRHLQIWQLMPALRASARTADQNTYKQPCQGAA